MSAFQLLLDHGVPGVELDVHICKSGELVVTHDANLKRITGLDAMIIDTEYSEIRRLDAGSWFGESYAGERIPLLDEVFDLLGDKVYYDIELKNESRIPGRLEQEVVKTVQRRGMQERMMLSSFNPYSIRAVRRLDHRIHTAHIYSDHETIPRLLRHGLGRFICFPQALKPNRNQISRRMLLHLQKIEGYPIFTWTEDDLEKAKHYLSLGVNGIITNVPEKMLESFREIWTKPPRR
jgi:glycerophosphoryl diester phosphodiesterase